MLKDLTELYRGAWRYALLCPLLFAVPVAAEFAQHVGEVGTGMYESYAAAEAVSAHPTRMWLGLVKSVALLLASYWTIRFLHAGARGAAGLDGRSLRLFAPVFAWGLWWIVAGLWGGDALAALGVPRDALTPIGLAAFLALFLFEPTLASWKASAAVGDGRIGFGRSIGLARGGWLWSLGFTLLAVFPPMLLHYAFAFLAIGRGPEALWTMLALDSLLVGYLAAVLAGTNLVIARRMLARAGLELQAGGALPSRSAVTTRAAAA